MLLSKKRKPRTQSVTGNLWPLGSYSLWGLNFGNFQDQGYPGVQSDQITIVIKSQFSNWMWPEWQTRPQNAKSLQFKILLI